MVVGPSLLLVDHETTPLPSLDVSLRHFQTFQAISETIRQIRLAMSPSMDTYRAIYHHLPSDWQRRPDRPQQTWLATTVYTVIYGNLALNWMTFQSLLLTVHFGGE